MFSVTISDSGVIETLLKAAGLTVKDFSPEWLRLGGQLVQEVRSEFAGERDPYGNKWAPLKPITIIVKRERHSQNADRILQDTRQLLDSFQYELMASGLSIYSDRRFPDGITAEIHQLGGTHPRTLNFIPSREMLPFKDQLPTDWMQWVEAFTDIGVNRIFK